MATVTVKGTWLEACGYRPAVNTEMEVLEVLGVMPNGRDRMYRVFNPITQSEWVVSDWRLVTVPHADGRED
jgi:hypothetical protein